jgi:hypothetical protein
MLVILVIIFAALLAVAFITTTRQPERTIDSAVQDAIDSFDRTFPTLSIQDIRAIRLSDPNSDVAFIMTQDGSGTWVTDEGTPLNENGALIARTMELLPYLRILPVTPEADLTEYGFAPNGLIRAEIVMNDDSVHGVAIGRLTDSGDAYYALVDNQPSIYVLLRNPVDYLITQLRNPPTA